VQVYIQLRSKEALISLPRGFLRLVQKAPKSIVRERLSSIGGWIRSAHALVHWTPPDIRPLRTTYGLYTRLDRWLRRGKQSFGVIRAHEARLDTTVLLDLFAKYHRLAKWLSDGIQLHSFIRAVIQPVPTDPLLQTKYMEWVWFQSVLERLDSIGTGLDSIERTLRVKSRRMFQNIIVDGTQLAIRCSEAPGLNELKDSQGRPTGAIVGFLRSLGSYRKKFPGAEIYVSWDGSSQRRRAMFPAYKENRSARTPLTFAFSWLRESLPYFGVHQVWNPDEEADDAIATLVRTSLKGQRNVIVSTDRDLLQLVTDTDYQFVPAVGSGKEKLYDVAAVTTEYSVPPESVVLVKAVCGDTSDNIPGATGFGLRTASKLIKVYASLDRLFVSGLAGLTKAQYTNLRAAEKQVKLNVELMKLHVDLPLTVLGPNPDRTAAATQLTNVDVQADSILSVLL
jgi:5'-3' exonuclease